MTRMYDQDFIKHIEHTITTCSMLMTCSIVCHHAVYLGSALPSDAQNAATAFLTVTDALALTIPTSTTFISGGHGRAQRLPSVRLKYTKNIIP